MLLNPQISPTDPGHRHIDNVIGQKRNLFGRALLQCLGKIDPAYNRLWTTGIANQDDAVFLRFRGKTSSIKDGLERGEIALKLNNARLLNLPADVDLSRCKLSYRHYDLGISQPRGSFCRNLFA